MKLFLSYSLPSVESRRAVVTYWRKYVYKYWLTAKRTKIWPGKVSRFDDWLDMSITVLTGL